MRLRLKNLVIASSLLAVALAVSTTSAKADSLTIFLSGPGGASVQCADGAACDTNPLAGVVTVTGLFGTATVAVTNTGTGTPLLAPLNLDLSYNLSANSSNPGGTFVVKVGETNLTATGVSFSGITNGNQGAGERTGRQCMEQFRDGDRAFVLVAMHARGQCRHLSRLRASDHNHWDRQRYTVR